MNAKDILNEEHANIEAIAAAIPGLQGADDLKALYATAYQHGSVILEIGAYHGKSAAVQLLGAISNRARQEAPVYIGIDVDLLAVFRTLKTLRTFGLADHAALYHGTLESFSEEPAITPTMVFLDGDHTYDGATRDLQSLEKICAPGTPVLCHDYTLDPAQELEAKIAIDDFVSQGRATFERQLGNCCALLTLTHTAKGSSVPFETELFKKLRERWLMDAALRLSESWLRLNEQQQSTKANLKASIHDLRVKSTALKSRLKALKQNQREYKPILGGLLYRRKRGGGTDAAK